MKRLLFFSLFAALFFIGCDSDSSGGGTNTGDACENVTCSGHGSCSDINGVPVCNCDDGYHAEGATCVKDSEVNSCDGVTCSNKGTCELVNNQAKCNCDSGYVADGLNCVEQTTDPCDGITCSDHGTCSVLNSIATCNCDAGYIPDGLTCIEEKDTIVCQELTGPETGCSVVNGTNDKILIQGIILGENTVYQGGSVLIDETGIIECVGCSCDSKAAGATKLVCPNGVVSPALINAHDHVGWTHQPPKSYQSLYDHRHEWRTNNFGKPKISAGSSSYSKNNLAWGELRNIMAGTTSIAGSGGTDGFLRNVDKGGVLNEGADSSSVYYDTFPLSDSDGKVLTTSCNYKSLQSESVMDHGCYLPHIAEGINDAARNEFLCLSSHEDGGHDLLESNTAIIHAVGLNAEDGHLMADERAAVIWSPRSNISLYGNTAQVTMYSNQGVLIGLGTDWVPSGSIQMFRELECADYLNKVHFNNFFTDKQIWEMATRNNAEALMIVDVLGILKEGRLADISIFNLKNASTPYRAVIEGTVKDVHLVLRGGMPQYGDKDLMDLIPNGQSGCESMGDVCGKEKSVCVKREIGITFNELKNANSSSYGLFFCGTPTGEPTCKPNRPGEYNGVTDTDKDGDGVADNQDNCPDIFNPVRPMDGTKQGDFDNDGIGDACDKCPTTSGTECDSIPNPYDKDGDNFANTVDNCPLIYNPNQVDGDGDGKGDECDSCPTVANPGTMGCPATIEDIKKGVVGVGANVTVRGVVTAVDAKYSDNFYIQTAVEDQNPELKEKYSGIYVYRSNYKDLKVGDYIDISGKVELYFGQLELVSITDVKKLGAGIGTMPQPVSVDPSKVKTKGTDAEAYEGVLINVGTVTVTSINPPPGGGESAPTNEIEVTGGLRVNDFFYLIPSPAVNDQYNLTGILRWNRENSKLEPRNASDVVKQ